MTTAYLAFETISLPLGRWALWHPSSRDAVKIVTITVPYSTVAWDVAIERGPKFGDHFGGPAPLLAVLAVALSTLPLLILTILAGRAAKLRATLTIQTRVFGTTEIFRAKRVP